MKKHFTPSFHLYALITVALWSTAYVFTKLVVDVYSPTTLAFLRILSACITMAVIIVWQKTPLPPRRELPRFILPGLLGFSVYYYLFNKGTSLTTPTTVVIAIAASSIYAAILARIIYGEHLRPAAWLAILIAFAGILVMTLGNGTMQLNTGVVWCTAAALSFALFNLVNRGLARTYSSLQINAYAFFAAVIPMFLFLPEAARELAAAPLWKTLIIVYLGVFPSAIAYLAWVKALALAPKTSSVTNYMFLTPFFSAVLEFAIMGSLPDAATLVGGAMILFSLALFSFVGKKR